MKILITGASSFTGCHIARAFSASTNKKDIKTWGSLTKKLSEYFGLEKERLTYSQIEHWIEEAPFGSERFIESIKEVKPDVLINHGASIKGYREKDFDVQVCVKKALLCLDEVVESLPKGCHFIHSGSVFEADKERNLEAYSPYGAAKTLIWNEILKYKNKLKISKIVIPDPVGLFENPDRLGPFFFRKWNLGERVDLRNSGVIQDRIPASWLAHIYFDEVVGFGRTSKETPKVVRPSAFCKTNLEWAKYLALYFEKKTNKKCPGWQILPDTDGERRNTEFVKEVFENEECEKFFDEYSEWLLR